MSQPGWYPSPDSPEKLAFWDGAQWTGELMDQPVVSETPILSRRELRLRRAEEGGAATMAFPTWEQRSTPESEPTPAVAEAIDFAPELPDDLPAPPTFIEPVPTEASVFPTVAEPAPTEMMPEPTEVVAFPTVAEPIPTVTEPMAVADLAESGDEFDAVLGVEPKAKKVRGPKTKEPKVKRVREPKVKEPKSPDKSDAKGQKKPGVKSGLIVAVIGLVVALVGILLVPALLDPTPAGGAVQPGENRATAIVRELNMDVDGYCHPVVEVPTGFGSFEVLALQLHELNTACPVKVGESATVYFVPGSGEPARYVTAGSVPVDLIMWSLFGVGMGAAAIGILRAWATRKGLAIPLVTPKA